MTGRWKRAASLLVIAVAVLLAPLLAAEPAMADSGNIFDSGSSFFIDNAGTHITLTGIAYSDCPNCGYDTSTRQGKASQFVYLGLSAKPADPSSIAVGELTSDTQAGNISAHPGELLNTLGCANPQYLTFDGKDKSPCWLQLSIDADHYAGLVCIGQFTTDHSSPAYTDSWACGFNVSGDSNGKARTGYDIGHGAEVALRGGDTTNLPGQQADGTVDPVACLGQEFGDFNPVTWILAPVKCAFLWAATPPTAMIPNLVDSLNKSWDGTQLGATVNELDFYNAFSVENSCTGITIGTSKLRLDAAWPHIDDMRLLATCGDSQLAGLAAIVKLGLTLSVSLGGAFAIGRMISQFIRGPQLAPAHASDFDDILMGK